MRPTAKEKTNFWRCKERGRDGEKDTKHKGGRCYYEWTLLSDIVKIPIDELSFINPDNAVVWMGRYNTGWLFTKHILPLTPTYSVTGPQRSLSWRIDCHCRRSVANWLGYANCLSMYKLVVIACYGTKVKWFYNMIVMYIPMNKCFFFFSQKKEIPISYNL